MPALGVVVAAVGGIQCAVEVPDRSHLQLAAAALVQVRAQTQGVDVHREHVEQVVVDEAVHVDVLGIAGLRIGEVEAVKGVLESIQVASDPCGLGRRDLSFLRVHVAEGPIAIGGIAAGRAKATVSRIDLVDLDHISSADPGLGAVPRLELLDVDPLLAPLDLLHEDIETDVVAGRDRAIVRVDVHFDKPGPDRVPADLIAQVVDESVVDQGPVVGVWSIQNPVGVGGHAENGRIPVPIVFVPNLESILGFGLRPGAPASFLDSGASREIRRVGGLRTSMLARIDDDGSST